MGCNILGKGAPNLFLKELTNDKNVSIRIAAAEALYHVGDKKKAISILTDALKSDILMARVQALNVLETMEEDAAPAYGAVEDLVTQKNGYDVRAAIKLLGQKED